MSAVVGQVLCSSGNTKKQELSPKNQQYVELALDNNRFITKDPTQSSRTVVANVWHACCSQLFAIIEST